MCVWVCMSVCVLFVVVFLVFFSSFYIFIVDSFFLRISFLVFYSPQHHLSCTLHTWMYVCVTVFILLMIWHHMPFVLSLRFDSILHFKYHLYGFLRMWLPIHIVYNIYNIHMYSYLSTFGSYSWFCSLSHSQISHMHTRTEQQQQQQQQFIHDVFLQTVWISRDAFFPYFIWFYYQFNMKVSFRFGFFFILSS